MAKTLLNGVNEVLTKLSLIQGDSGVLTTLSDSARQVFIDKTVQAWNELMEEVYSIAGKSLPNVLAENTITLATSDRDYALQSNLVEFHFPLLDETNGRFIHEYPGGYEALVNDQLIPASYTGLPVFAVIRPTDGELYLDHLPTAAENGLVYKYRYDKDVSVSLAADIFPFSDSVFRAMVPAVAEIVSRRENKDFDAPIYRASMGRAARLLNKLPSGDSWSRRS